MTKLPDKKRNQLIFLILGTVLAMAAIWYWLIRPQKSDLASKRSLLANAKDKVQAVQRKSLLLEYARNDLDLAQRRLQRIELKIASGDPYRWIIRTFSDFSEGSNVEVSNFDPPRVGDSNLLPTVPYKAAYFSLSGAAYFNDLGRYLANLENTYPHLILQRLDVEPSHLGEAAAEDDEKLNFKMEMAVLLKATTL